MNNAIADGTKPYQPSEEDIALLDNLSPVIKGKKYPLPVPTLPVNERHRRRAMFGELLMFFPRTCDLTGKPIISIYNPEKAYPVYSIEAWWSDRWDDLANGKDIDFHLPFFEQFLAVHDLVPKMATYNENCENCEFCSSAGNARNCYYCRTAHHSEDIFYSDTLTGGNSNCSDSLRSQRCERIHESIQCLRCHSSSYLFRCQDMVESHFCSSCKNCKQCLFCHNLVNKEYHIRNVPVSREEFERIQNEVTDGKQSTLETNLQEWQEMNSRKTVWPSLQQVNCENCVGDALFNCANVYECYMCFNLVDCRYCWDMSPSKECHNAMDITKGGIGELFYNTVSAGGGCYNILCSGRCRKSSELLYCIDCYSCKNCFGCSGLKSKQYCILNKQYTKDAYESLVARIIHHMMGTGEWGEYFPQKVSAFAYNHSLAMHFFPLTKEEALAEGLWWSDYEPRIEAKKTIPAEKLPDSINDIPDDVLNWAIVCEKSKRPFKMVKQELKYLREIHHPAPREHPDVRMQRRREMLNPYRLWDRSCRKCGAAIQSSLAPERPEIVYCEECYLKEVY